MKDLIEYLALREAATGLTFLLACSAAQASVNISSGATKHMSCSSGVCTPTAKRAVLNVTDLTNLLQASDVKVTTGSGAVTIEVTAPLSWASASRLTLDANLNVTIKARVTVTGPGGLSIVTNDGGSGGDLSFLPGGKVDFWNVHGSLVVNGNAYTLVTDIHTLASDIAANPSGSFAIIRDYEADKDGLYNHSPIATPMNGVFEGLGHTINKLAVKNTHSDCIGLFAQISAGGTVRDINLRRAHVIITHHANVGALVGCNSGLVVNDYSDGSIHSRSGSNQRAHIGGLVGLNDQGTVLNSASAATVSGSSGSFVGGLVGENGYGALEGTIIRSHATGEVAGDGVATVGGLVGYNGSSSIVQSWASGSVVVGDAGTAGGLTGESSIGFGANIVQCFATGSVSGEDALLGGFAGIGEGITQSYAAGSVTDVGSEGAAGGFDGEGDGITQSYSLGAVAGPADGRIGGFLGVVEFSGDSANSYWDTETSGFEQGCGQGTCSGISGLTTQQFQSGLPAGFDPTVWGENPSINGGFPYLLALPPAR